MLTDKRKYTAFSMLCSLRALYTESMIMPYLQKCNRPLID